MLDTGIKDSYNIEMQKPDGRQIIGWEYMYFPLLQILNAVSCIFCNVVRMKYCSLNRIFSSLLVFLLGILQLHPEKFLKFK